VIGTKRIAVVMPAYNVAETLARTVAEIDRGIVDDVILVDNKSNDETVRRATELNIFVFCQTENRVRRQLETGLPARPATRR